MEPVTTYRAGPLWLGYRFACCLCAQAIQGRVPWADRALIVRRVQLKLCQICVTTTDEWQREVSELAQPPWAVDDDEFVPYQPSSVWIEQQHGVEEARSDLPISASEIKGSPEQYICRDCGSSFEVPVAYRTSPPPDHCPDCRARGAHLSIHGLRGGAVNPR